MAKLDLPRMRSHPSHLASAGAGPERYAAVVKPPGRGEAGSLEATRRSFNKDFLLALAADFKKHGAAAIEKVRKQQPAAYMKICALLVPREMKLEHSGSVKEMTDQQIDDAIAAIKQMIAEREAGMIDVTPTTSGRSEPESGQ